MSVCEREKEKEKEKERERVCECEMDGGRERGNKCVRISACI